MAAELVDLSPSLALFARGITGRDYEIKPIEEFTGKSVAPGSGPLQHARAVYLPAIYGVFPDARHNRGALRVMALHQLGYREFGTFGFDITIAAQLLPGLGTDPESAVEPRAADLEKFFASFRSSALARRLFILIEAARVDRHMVAAYPGARNDLQRLRSDERLTRPVLEVVTTLADLFEALTRWSLGEDTSSVVDLTGCLDSMVQACATAATAQADVYAAAAATLRCYQILDAAQLLHSPATVTDAEAVEGISYQGEPPLEWLQREERLEAWNDELKSLDAALAFGAEAADEALLSEGLDGQTREKGDITALAEERDTLARRIEMESSAINYALGRDAPDAPSYLYDEWDYHGGRYLKSWCRLYEVPTESGDADAAADMVRRTAPLLSAVRRRFAQIKPRAYQRIHKVADGEELDWNRVIEHQIDLKRGVSPDERVYQHRARIHREVTTAFLVDISASTDDPVDKPDPGPASAALDDSTHPHLRDPYGGIGNNDDDDPYLWELKPPDPDAASPRRIIDVQKDALWLMAEALQGFGDAYGIFGFSGYGRHRVEYYVAKDFNDAFGGRTLSAVTGLKPRRSTRMGPAIRHTTQKLKAAASALRVLIVISDGFPQDSDYGPARGEHEYGVQDTAKALEEARRAGIETFCLTVDRSGHDYLKRMCPDDRYMVIEDTEALPEALSKVYEKLTG
jgi:hypothetical protein